MVSAIFFIDFQLFYFLTRIIPENPPHFVKIIVINILWVCLVSVLFIVVCLLLNVQQ
jgi:hypothetical protein